MCCAVIHDVKTKGMTTEVDVSAAPDTNGPAQQIARNDAPLA